MRTVFSRAGNECGSEAGLPRGSEIEVVRRGQHQLARLSSQNRSSSQIRFGTRLVLSSNLDAAVVPAYAQDLIGAVHPDVADVAGGAVIQLAAAGDQAAADARADLDVQQGALVRVFLTGYVVLLWPAPTMRSIRLA